MLESEKYGFHAPTPEPTAAVSTLFLDVVPGFLFGSLEPSNVGMPTLTVLHKFVVSMHPGLAPLLMPKLAPKIVMVAAALKGADGAGLVTAVLVPAIDVIVGAEYLTAAVIDPVSCQAPQETTPVLAEPMLPRRP
jgi:hypothetical protein